MTLLLTSSFPVAAQANADNLAFHGVTYSVLSSAPIYDISHPAIASVYVPDNILHDIKILVRLSHPYISDLVVTLIHPSGVTADLMVRRGGSGNDLGAGATSCDATPTMFTDSSPTPIFNVWYGIAPFIRLRAIDLRTHCKSWKG